MSVAEAARPALPSSTIRSYAMIGIVLYAFGLVLNEIGNGLAQSVGARDLFGVGRRLRLIAHQSILTWTRLFHKGCDLAVERFGAGPGGFVAC